MIVADVERFNKALNLSPLQAFVHFLFIFTSRSDGCVNNGSRGPAAARLLNQHRDVAAALQAPAQGMQEAPQRVAKLLSPFCAAGKEIFQDGLRLLLHFFRSFLSSLSLLLTTEYKKLPKDSQTYYHHSVQQVKRYFKIGN